MKTKLHFQRFEFKYLLNQKQEALVKNFIRPYLKRDGFAEGLPNGEYEVVSLYYDSPSLFFYHQKIDGVKKRKKIRLRTYRNRGKFHENAFFEIKRKNDAVVLKDRFLINSCDYDQLIRRNGLLKGGEKVDGLEDELRQELRHDIYKHSASPTLLVVYNREPYVGKYTPYLRITFDKNIRARTDNELFYKNDEFTDVSPNTTVMEIKFSGTLPVYIHKAIKMFNLQRISYSKYCQGIERCGIISRLGVYQSYYKNNNMSLVNKKQEICSIL